MESGVTHHHGRSFRRSVGVLLVSVAKEERGRAECMYV